MKPAETTAGLFEQAVRQHMGRLLTVARSVVGTRASPEDVVQQAIMNLYEHRDRYNWEEAGGLLRRAVMNEALRVLRRPRMGGLVEDLPEPEDPHPSSRLEDAETVRRVREAIDRLPEHFRSALVLCEYERMSYAEIAQTLNASVPQVKTWIHRARRQLETMLKDYVEGNRPPAGTSRP